jgi:uncharacterized protein YcaQ
MHQRSDYLKGTRLMAAHLKLPAPKLRVKLLELITEKGPMRGVDLCNTLWPNGWDAHENINVNHQLRTLLASGKLGLVDSGKRLSPYDLAERIVRPSTNGATDEPRQKRVYTKREGTKTSVKTERLSVAEDAAMRKFLIADIREKLDRLERLG